MKKNVGRADQWIRVIVGIALLVLLFTVESGWRWAGLLGFVMLGTGLVRFCPLYTLFGINTNKESK